MTTAQPLRASVSHIERTAGEPRDDALFRVTLSRITPANNTVKLFQLVPVRGQRAIRFLPGQWLDVHVPGIPKPGGFTLTSTPSQAVHPIAPYLELAIQNSPQNPPAAFLWRPEREILATELHVRVGGSFLWPPRALYSPEGVRRAVFIAGGVGVNPLVSMLSFLAERKEKVGMKRDTGIAITLLYSTKDPGVGREADILFLERLVMVFRVLGQGCEFKLFLTGASDGSNEARRGTEFAQVGDQSLPVHRRRILGQDWLDALGPVEERNATVCYICGVPSMTDEFVEKAVNAEGMLRENVLFEKWW